MMTLSVDIKGIEDALDDQQRIQARLTDLSPVWESFAHHELAMAQQRIDEGGPGWPPTHFPANLHPMLKRTGALYASLDPTTNDTTHVSNDGVEFGTPLDYAIFQQDGTKEHAGLKRKTKGLNSFGGIEPRRFLYASDDDIAWLEEAVKAYVLNGELPAE